ncbi:MAG: hypothetical protein KF868_13560 [Acidobacteria bacterium]|nr:hypothetical protein [Acidobacteriota bacterium]
MPVCEETTFRGRSAIELCNDELTVTLLKGGGHVARMQLAGSKINPLWEPPWPGLEPRDYDTAQHSGKYGPVEGRLLASIAGHSLCLDHFGEPSAAEAAVGGYFHGEAPNLEWEIIDCRATAEEAWLDYGLELPEAGIRFRRRFSLGREGTVVVFDEEVTNLRTRDVPLGYQQHVTCGPPFVSPGITRVDLPGRRGRTYPHRLGPFDRLQPDADFVWPHAAGSEGQTRVDVFSSGRPTTSVCTVLQEPENGVGFIAVSNAEAGLLLGYIFDAELFPWTALWEENCATSEPPYDGRTVAWGIEFGTTPLPVTRIENLSAGPLYDRKRFTVLPAGGSLRGEYRAFLLRIPEDWAGVERLVSTDREIIVEEVSGGRRLQLRQKC